MRFHVRFGSSSSKSDAVAQSFVVELAPLDRLPHAVYFFLDMVQAQVWDDSVLLHREDAHHVISAAPVHYQTGESKLHHVSFVGWTHLGFPEYDPNWSHDPYTMGFTHLGPNFYFNSANNAAHHGPGGQGHHTLETDADPCFGRVVEGRDVVDALLFREEPMPPTSSSTSEYYRQQAAVVGSVLSAPRPPPLPLPSGDRHAWAHLVSIEFLPNYISSVAAV